MPALIVGGGDTDRGTADSAGEVDEGGKGASGTRAWLRHVPDSPAMSQPGLP